MDCAAHQLLHAVPFVAGDCQKASAGEPGTEKTDRSGVPDLPGKRHPDPRRLATQLPSGSAWMDGADNCDVFHTECVDPALRRQHKCPICRQQGIVGMPLRMVYGTSEESYIPDPLDVLMEWAREKGLDAIPQDKQQLSELSDELDLSSKRLTVLPKEIGHLTGVTLLMLNNNQLTEIPVEIGKLHSLLRLELDDNQLKSIPKQLGDLSSLQKRIFHKPTNGHPEGDR